MAGIKKLNGGSWVDFCDNNQIYKLENGAWRSGSPSIFKLENGIWVQIYPSTGVTENDKVVNPQRACSTKQKKYSSWKSGYARHGYCTQSSAGGEQFGYTNVFKSDFTGHGSVVEVSSVFYTGYRNASGGYNNNQVINFHGTTMTSASGDPFGSAAGTCNTLCGGTNFTTTTNAPSANAHMNRRPISNTSAFKNFLNGMNGAYALALFNGETSNNFGGGYGFSANYLGMNDCMFNISYKHSAYRAFAPDPINPMSKSGEPQFIELYLYPDELGMSIEDIFERREREGISHIDPENTYEMDEYTPIMNNSYKKEGIIHLKFDFISEGHEVQYKDSEGNWNKMLYSMTEDSYYIGYFEGLLPIRVIDKLRFDNHLEFELDTTRLEEILPKIVI